MFGTDGYQTNFITYLVDQLLPFKKKNNNHNICMLVLIFKTFKTIIIFTEKNVILKWIKVNILDI